jgi:MYXO-CTERM domain-containing protein
VRALAGIVTAALVLFVAGVAHGHANVVIVNADPVDAGFNDMTPATPIGGNCGTTLGAQRLAVFQRAAEIWGNALNSSAPITILSHFEPLTCGSSGSVLGSAGPTNIFASDDPTLPTGIPASVFPKQHTWYVSALVGAFAGVPVVSGTGTDSNNYDILARFNSALDSPATANCGGLRWYYGLDDNHGSDIDLLTVVLHEFGHGLGFLSLTNQDGTFPVGADEPDIWSYFQYDEASGLHWVEMDAGTRAASAISGGLAWDGPSVKATVPSTLSSLPFRVNSAPPADSAVVKVYDQITVAQFSPPIGSTLLTRDLNNTSSTFGCSTEGHLAALDGKIAIVSRGGPNDAGCSFVEKARNAQDAGATGLLIYNNTTGLITPSGDAPDIVIPVLFLTQDDGTALRSAVTAGTVNGTIGRDPANGFTGADSSARGLLYAPAPWDPGSSVSHWDISAFPNLLMEPVINADLTHSLDLTVNLLRDIGWSISDAGAGFANDAGPLTCPGPGGPDGGGGSDAGGGGGGGASSGCTSSAGPPAPWLALLGLLLFVRRKRSA